jgi:hypothetical protein
MKMKELSYIIALKPRVHPLGILYRNRRDPKFREFQFTCK